MDGFVLKGLPDYPSCSEGIAHTKMATEGWYAAKAHMKAYQAEIKAKPAPSTASKFTF